MRAQQKNAPFETQTNGFDTSTMPKTETSDMPKMNNMNITTRNKTEFSQHNLLSQSVMGPLHKTFFDLKSPQK